MTQISWHPGALRKLAASAPVEQALEKAATKLQRDAVAEVRSVYPRSDRWRAIQTEKGTDSDSVFVDVGYKKSHYGFVLWWTEVGTAETPARPHLRAALDRAR